MKVHHFRRILWKLLSILIAFSMAMGSFLTTGIPTALACYNWSVGQRVGLRGGAEIRHGSYLSSPVHTIVPNDNWQVDIIGGPRYADGQEWWDISRQNIDGGGTGWVYKAQAGYDLCGSTPPPSPGKLILIQDLSVSTTSPSVNQEISGTYRVKNSGGQAITIEYLGIQGRLNGDINGLARDFNWVQNLTLQPGQEFTYSSGRSFDVSGSWRLRPNYRMNGVWSDVHRDNGTINEVWINVQDLAPGNIQLVEGLSLTPSNPVVGQSVNAYFMAKNNGGQSITFGHIGVKCRRNSDDANYDYYWMTGVTLSPGQELIYNANRSFDQANSYWCTPNYELNGSWSDIKWPDGTVNYHTINVQNSPGQISVLDDLSLRVDASSNWPPSVGNKIIAHIRIKNTGGQTLNLNRIGVRGRKNGVENWDIGWWSVNLSPGAEWTLDPNNERPLEPGSYSFRISYSIDGSNWQEIGNEVNFVVNEPLQPTNSSRLIRQSNTASVQPGSSLQLSLELQNSGTTTWSGTSGYQLVLVGGSALGANKQQPLAGIITPGALNRWTLPLQAPGSPGTYTSQWQMEHNGSRFGDVVTLQVNVVSGTISYEGTGLELISSLQVQTLSGGPPTTAETYIASFSVQNTGESAIFCRKLGVGGRGPYGEYDIQDFSWFENITFNSGQTIDFSSTRKFEKNGPYYFFSVCQLQSGEWRKIPAREGLTSETWITIDRQAAPGKMGIRIDYSDRANEVVNITPLDVNTQPDGSTSTLLLVTSKKHIYYDIFWSKDGTVQCILQGNGRDAFTIDNSLFLPPMQELTLCRAIFPVGSNMTLHFSKWGWEGHSLDKPAYLTLDVLEALALLLLGDHPPRDRNYIGWIFGGILDEFLDILNKYPLDLGVMIYKMDQGDLFGAIEAGAAALSRFPEAASEMFKAVLGLDVAPAKAAQLFGRLAKLIGARLLIPWTNDLWRAPARVDVRLIPEQQLTSSALSVEEKAVQSEEMTGKAPTYNLIPMLLTSITSELTSGFESYQVVDRSISSAWGNGADLAAGQWITLRTADGSPVSIDELWINPGPSTNSPSWSALKDFHVDTSMDGIHYQTVLWGSFTIDELGGYKIFYLNKVPALFLRLVVDANQDTGGRAFTNIAEVVVFGDRIGSAPDTFEPDTTQSLAMPITSYFEPQKHTFSYAEDVDWIMFKAQIGKEYEIETSNPGPGVATFIELYNAAGELVAADYSSDTSISLLKWVAEHDGTYFVKIMNRNPDAFGDQAGYSIRIFTPGETLYLPISRR